MGTHRAAGGHARRPARSLAASTRHRADRPRHRSVRLSALPALLGALALAVAGPGALTAGDQGSTASASASSVHPLTSRDGTDATGFTEGDRELAVSRDSERQALQDAARAPLRPRADEQARQSNGALRSLGRAAEAHAAQVAKVQWHLPTVGYQLTARFGQAGGLWSSNHTGLDFAAPTGTPVFAVGSGVITQTGWAGSYGNRTVETLPDGTELWYAHQSVISVSTGQKVVSGQRIGEIGATGNVTGPHVHLEVRPGAGDPVDPYAWLVVHGLKP